MVGRVDAVETSPRRSVAGVRLGMKSLWPPALFALLLIGVAAFFALSERKRLTEAPCEEFANDKAGQMPARCLNFYTRDR